MLSTVRTLGLALLLLGLPLLLLQLLLREVLLLPLHVFGVAPIALLRFLREPLLLALHVLHGPILRDLRLPRLLLLHGLLLLLLRSLRAPLLRLPLLGELLLLALRGLRLPIHALHRRRGHLCLRWRRLHRGRLWRCRHALLEALARDLLTRPVRVASLLNRGLQNPELIVFFCQHEGHFLSVPGLPEVRGSRCRNADRGDHENRRPWPATEVTVQLWYPSCMHCVERGRRTGINQAVRGKFFAAELHKWLPKRSLCC